MNLYSSYLVILFSIFGCLIAGYIFYKKSLYIWLPNYFKDAVFNLFKSQTEHPIHIMFCIVDHYEPGTGGVDFVRARRRVTDWVTKYPKMVTFHSDANGVYPQHTWFYPPHHHQADHLKRVVGLCKKGYGEVELHLHHNRQAPFPDTSSTLTKKITDAIKEYSQYGIFGRFNGNPAYGFIHGNWALDNADGGKHCGINNEIQILHQTGCYADFTYPAPDACQPRCVNKIYYTKDNPDKPKSHDTGVPVSVGDKPYGDLMIIQGPMGLRWRGKAFLSRPVLEKAELDFTNQPTESRIDYWIKNGLTVRGRQNWKFIKLHCHGAPEYNHKSLFGPPADHMFTILETKYNDGKKYILHYVTAREMYNIIKAAEAGLNESPHQYRNFVIESPKYNENSHNLSLKAKRFDRETT